MTKRILAMAMMAAVVLAAGARAADVNVSDYSWLQLAPTAVTPIVGGAELVSPYSAHGSIGDFRWGNFTWVPNWQLTGGGAATYWAGIQFDRPREVETVNVQPWTSSGQELRRYYVDGYADGAWSLGIGSHDYEEMGQYQSTVTVNVTDGVYEAIRVRYEPGDYTGTSDGYGGPGFRTIEPFGDGVLSLGDVVNYANQPNFSTTISANILGSPTHTDPRVQGGWNNGTLRDDNPQNGCNGNWVPGDYLQIDLGASRTIDRVTVCGNGEYTPKSYNVYVSADGAVYTQVTAGLSGGDRYPLTTGYLAALEYTFNPLEARYVRITDAVVNSGGYILISQVMVAGTVVPEPATAAVLALGAMGLLRRRGRRA
ncbi:MAG: F5/8 type C domain protein [Lentisphaerae bacterium ADurb.BinA184]|nr:MAG: F5/8 type C domain protein [Lentisphaerae bacterium ADurb.BinA184]